MFLFVIVIVIVIVAAAVRDDGNIDDDDDVDGYCNSLWLLLWLLSHSRWRPEGPELME